MDTMNLPSGLMSMPLPCPLHGPANAASAREPGEDERVAGFRGCADVWLAEVAQLKHAAVRMAARATARTPRSGAVVHTQMGGIRDIMTVVLLVTGSGLA